MSSVGPLAESFPVKNFLNGCLLSFGTRRTSHWSVPICTGVASLSPAGDRGVGLCFWIRKNRSSRYHHLPSSVVFVGRRGNEVVQRPRPARNRGVGLFPLEPQKWSSLASPSFGRGVGGRRRSTRGLSPHTRPNCKRGARKTGPKSSQRAWFCRLLGAGNQPEAASIVDKVGGERSPAGRPLAPPPLVTRRRRPTASSWRAAADGRPEIAAAYRVRRGLILR